MADQIIDKVDVGIPLDVELAVERAKRAADEAEGHADDAQAFARQAAASATASASSASQSAGYADDAREYAELAGQWSQADSGIVVSDSEPPGVPAGTVWFETEGGTLVVGIHVMGAGSAGLYPSAATWPGDAAYPGAPIGDAGWRDLSLSQALVTS